MGRPKKVITPFAAAHWHHSNECEAHTVGVGCKQQFVFHCTCLNHVSVRTVEAVCRNPKTLVCGVCNPVDVSRAPSMWETRAYGALQNLGVTDMMTEVKILGGRYSAADVMLFIDGGRCVVVMVDGEQHFRSTRVHRDSDAQFATDCAFNNEALAQGFYVVRLHYKDAWQYERVLRQCLTICTEAPQPLLVRSPAYHF
jgi:hypothetical protein